MRKITLIMAATLLLCGKLFAGSPDVAPIVLTNIKWTNSVVVTGVTTYVSGYIERIDIVLKTVTSTNLLVVQISTNYGTESPIILFSNTVTSSISIRPRYPVHDNAGNQLGIATNSWDKILLVNEIIKATAVSGDASQTNALNVVFRLWR